MNDLKLPESLAGPWHHALFMTYNLDLPFFERTLWRQLRASCRNKIVLADGMRYLAACEDWARDGSVRHLNQLYIGDGIFGVQSAHAKLILLVNPKAGRLLVGSGNLGMSGFASGGEAFSQYEYSDESPEHLGAFSSVAEMLRLMIARNYVTHFAAKRIERVMDETPWLFISPADGNSPVRHNLSKTFINQLTDIIGERQVEELWLHAPFHDERGVALERMLQTFRPKSVYLLIQSGMTMINLDALARIQESYPGALKIMTIRRKLDVNPFIHAKFYLFKLQEQAVILHGSPNISQVALLQSPPQGNIELANLLIGERSEFDPFLNGLTCDPYVDDLMSLHVRPRGQDDVPEELDLGGWYLTGGEWSEPKLLLRYRGNLPEIHDGELIIGSQTVTDISLHITQHTLEVALPNIVNSLFDSPVPVQLRWRHDEQVFLSNPIFVCNTTALNRILNVEESDSVIDRIGDLNLDDKELEQLLHELDASFPIDGASIWQIVGTSRTIVNASGEEEAIHMAYADIDFGAVQNHPRLQQYFNRGSQAGFHVGSTKLQIVLNMIIAHFQKLKTGDVSARDLQALVMQVEEGVAESEEERETEESEAQERHWSAAARLQRLFVNFIDRFLVGINDKEFQEYVGHNVLIPNWIIFHHVLWQLFSKDWIDDSLIARSLLNLWIMLWGKNETDGYLASLQPDQREDALFWLREHHADAQMLAALIYCDTVAVSAKDESLRVALRDFGRQFLTSWASVISTEVLEDIWIIYSERSGFVTPLPSELTAKLETLFRFETENTFLRSVEQTYCYLHHRCEITSANVYRPATGTVKVRCLQISDDRALGTKEEALAMLNRWIAFEDLDYYRIASPDVDKARSLIFFDCESGEGYCRIGNNSEVHITQEHLQQSIPNWLATLKKLYITAEQVEDTLTMPVSISSEHSDNKEIPVTV
ncbi:MAG: hypothetical protein R3A44_28060 [Caldilineaceae bacterium]